MALFGPVWPLWVFLYPFFVGIFLPLYSKFTGSLRKKNTGARIQKEKTDTKELEDRGKTEPREQKRKQEARSKERREQWQNTGARRQEPEYTRKKTTKTPLWNSNLKGIPRRRRKVENTKEGRRQEAKSRGPNGNQSLFFSASVLAISLKTSRSFSLALLDFRSASFSRLKIFTVFPRSMTSML